MPGASAPGLRERNKLEKRQRIRDATRELFSARGFEATTLRQIADRAQVGLGTLFNYARDKRDLTFLLFNDDLARLVEEAKAASARKTGVLEQVMAVWEPHYHYFARDPVLCRILLRDMYFYVEGEEAERFHRTAARLQDHLEMLLVSAQHAGLVSGSASADAMASLLFYVYQGSVRDWMEHPRPVAKEGLAALRQLVQMSFRGLLADGGPVTRKHDAPARTGDAASDRAKRVTSRCVKRGSRSTN